jgi:hypothetical protein
MNACAYVLHVYVCVTEVCERASVLCVCVCVCVRDNLLCHAELWISETCSDYRTQATLEIGKKKRKKKRKGRKGRNII